MQTFLRFNQLFLFFSLSINTIPVFYLRALVHIFLSIIFLHSSICCFFLIFRTSLPPLPLFSTYSLSKTYISASFPIFTQTSSLSISTYEYSYCFFAPLPSLSMLSLSKKHEFLRFLFHYFYFPIIFSFYMRTVGTSASFYFFLFPRAIIPGGAGSDVGSGMD